MAFIAIAEASGKMLGVVRLHDDPSGDAGEFAILVRSRLKGHGLGWLLMKHMIAYAKEKGLKIVRGEVLAENTSMLLMCCGARLPCRATISTSTASSAWSCCSTRSPRKPCTDAAGHGSATCATSPRARASTTPSARKRQQVIPAPRRAGAGVLARRRRHRPDQPFQQRPGSAADARRTS